MEPMVRYYVILVMFERMERENFRGKCERVHVVSSDLTDFYATNDDVQFVHVWYMCIYIYVDLI